MPTQKRVNVSTILFLLLIIPAAQAQAPPSSSTSTTTSAGQPFSTASSEPTKLSVGTLVGALGALAACAALVLLLTTAHEMRAGPCCGVRSTCLASFCGLWPLPRKIVTIQRFWRPRSAGTPLADVAAISVTVDRRVQPVHTVNPIAGDAIAVVRVAGAPRLHSNESPLLPPTSAYYVRDSPLRARDRIPSFNAQSFRAEGIVSQGRGQSVRLSGAPKR